MAVAAALPWIVGGVSAAGTLLSAYSTYQQGQIEKATADYNARTQEVAADQADLEAREEIRRIRSQNRSQLAARRAAIGASGAVGFAGSPLAVLGEEAGRLELQALDFARSAEAQRRRGYAQAAQTRFAGRQARRAANIGTGATLLSGAAKTYSLVA